MPKGKKKDAAVNLAQEVATLTESEALAALEATKNVICLKAKTISQQRAAKKDVVGGYNETIKFLVEEQESELIRKSLIEDHLKVLGVQFDGGAA